MLRFELANELPKFSPIRRSSSASASAGGAVVRGEIIEQIVVKVNGEILTKTELENRQVAALRQMGQQVDPKTNPSDAQLRQMLDQVTPQLLVNTVDEMLLVQRGRELGYKMADDQFQSVLDSIKKDNKIESDEQFQAALKAENMTLVRPAQEPRTADDRVARPAERGDEQDRRERRGGARLLRRAPQRVHLARAPSRCAKSS